MIVTIFRSRLALDHLAEYEVVAARIDATAARQPGFISCVTYGAPDGERVTVAEWATWEAHEAWRRHPEHREAQRLGRERFYLAYRIQVCEQRRSLGAESAERDG